MSFWAKSSMPDDADGARLRTEPAVPLVVEEPLGDPEPGDVLRRDPRGRPPLAGLVHVAAEEDKGREERDDDEILDPLRGIDVYKTDAFHVTTSMSSAVFSSTTSCASPNTGIRRITHRKTQISMLMIASVIQISITEG